MLILLIYLLGDFLVSHTLGWGVFFFLGVLMLLNLNDLYSYSFSLDLVSYIIILLTFLIMGFMYNSLRGDKVLSYNIGCFYISLITLTLLVVFLSLDLIIFYFSFEFVVVPIFFIILTMGRRIERLQSAIYLFLYTLITSMPFLILLISIFEAFRGLSFILFFFFEHYESYW